MSRPSLLVFLSLALAACSGDRPPVPSLEAGPGAQQAVAAPTKQLPLKPWTGEPPPGWSEVERLQEEQKFEAAAEKIDAVLADARTRGHSEHIVRALVRAVQLRTALHGYETAVRFLRDEAWPEDLLAQVTLKLFYANALVTYARQYGWEVRQRERVVSTDAVDLKKWTWAQIHAEADAAFRDVWLLREQLGAQGNDVLAAYLKPGSYPRDLRATLRGTTTYLWIDRLTDRSGWRPEHSNGVFRLDLAALLAPSIPLPDLANADVHPLRKAAALLADLEGWHAAAGRTEAAFAARLARLEMLHGVFDSAEDRSAIRAALAEALPAARETPWWAMGMGALAEMRRAVNDADAHIEALRIAQEALAVYPGGVGGPRCTALVRAIEQPTYDLDAMSHDAPDRRSVGLTHKHVPRMHFRAWRVDLKAYVEKQKDYDLLPDRRFVENLVDDTKPDAAWAVDLPPTPDHRTHRTWVVPPMTEPGAYVIAATPDPKFDRDDAPMRATLVLLGDLMVVHRARPGAIEGQVLSGGTGAPLAGVDVSLYRFDWQRGHHRVGRVRSGADGRVRFAVANHESHFLLAQRGDELALDGNHLQGAYPRQRDVRLSVLMYTDRSVYRPGQTVQWKAVTYRSGDDDRLPALAPSAKVKVQLYDANGEVVQTAEVKTNAWGSASGSFVAPPGRALGRWSVRANHPTTGGGVRIEEYKRPTFEVKFLDAEGPLRLNRPAALKGEARYYFGLPVTAGKAVWRVERRPIYPWWWWGAQRSSTQTVATGESPLDAEGHFVVKFTPEADERLAEGDGRAITYAYSVDADVTDEGGETRSAAKRVRLGFVAVDATVSTDARFFDAGEAGAVTIRRTDLDGAPAAGEGQWRLVRLDAPEATPMPADLPVKIEAERAKYATPGDRQRARWDTGYTTQGVLRDWADGAEVAKGMLTHGEDGNGTVTLPALEAGAYRVRYTTTDPFGATFETHHDLLVAAPKSGLPLPAVLETKATSAAVGGTIELFVHGGVPGQPLFLERWRGDERVEQRTLIAGTDPARLQVPVTAADRGGVGFVLVMARDHQLIQQTRSVHVPWDSKTLSLSFETFRDTLRPGQAETWTVKVKGPKAAGGAAEVLAYMYDRSLDIFAPHQPPSVLALYPNRGWTPPVRSTLGVARRLYLQSGNFGRVPGWSRPQSAHLEFFDGYGVGGPGGRYARRVTISADRMMLAEAEGAPAPPPAPAEAPAATATLKSEPAPEPQAPSDDSAEEQSTAAPADAGGEQVRSNFSETAFWSPHLTTDADGTVKITFEVPDSVTSWNVWVHAISKDLAGGSLQTEARTVKELIVRPYLPRFLRETDTATLDVVVNNASDGALKGTLDFEIFDPETEASLLGDFGLDAAKTQGVAFEAPKGGSAKLSFPVKAPSKLGTVAFRVKARTGAFSDGELRPLPVLPGRVHLAQSRFAALKGAVTKTLRFEELAKNDDPTLENESLVVTLDGQLFYGVLSALPYLVNYPYECTEQTLNRFLATGILSSLFDDYPAVAAMAKTLSKRDTRLETWDAPDPNRKMALEETPWLREARGGGAEDLEKVLDPDVARAQRKAALAKLEKAQTAIGGFPWFPGGPPSPYITLYLLHGFSKGLEFGVEVPKPMVQRGWRYLKQHHVDEAFRYAQAHDCCWEFVTFLNYVLSNYPDNSWYAGTFSDADRKAMLDFSFGHWKQHSPYLKAYLALTLHRAGRKDDALLVWESVLDSAKEGEDQGTYWAPEDRAWLWYNDRIETHAFALRTTMALKPDWPKLDGLVLWLFLNKKLNHWESTKATAEVIYSLAHYLKATGQLGAREETLVKVGDLQKLFVFEPDVFTGKKNQVVIPGGEIEPKHAEITLQKKTEAGYQLASATWHFSTEKMPDAAHGDFLSVQRAYFRRDKKGREVTLEPLKDGTPLVVGDEVEVHLSLRSKHALEYVHLRDPRGAGFEPVSLRSEHKWDLGIRWYEEVRDSGTNFFFEALPHGEYTFKYRLRATTAGAFKVGPATVQPMYAPEFNAYSSGATLTIGRQP